MIIELYDWAVGSVIGIHRPPRDGQRLSGTVKNHPFLDDGTFTMTTEIIDIEGRIVKTKGSHSYRLVKINPKYRKWLKKYFPDWDSKKPIEIRTPVVRKAKGNGIKIKKRK